MRQLNEYNHHNPSTLVTQWHTALPGLVLSTLTAVLAGIAMLAALWYVIVFINHTVWSVLGYACLFWVLMALFSACSSWLAHHTEAQFAAKLRRNVAQHLIRLPKPTLAKHNEQTLKQLLIDDIASLHHMVAHLPSEIAVFSVIPLLSIAILVNTIGWSALWVLLPGAIASLYYLLIMPYMTKRDGMARMQVMREIITKADEYVGAIPIYRIYGQHNSALSAYTQAVEHFTRTMVMWVAKVATPAAIAVALLQAVATFAVAYWVSYQHDSTTIAITLFFSLAIVTPVLRLGHGVDYIRAGKEAAKRLDAFLQQPLLPSGSISQRQQPARLSLNKATLYQEERPIFQQLSFDFPPNAITAITGPSGVGKTTLLNALAGFVPLTSGHIAVGEVDVTALHEVTRQQQILLIAQGYDVLEDTVRANLALTAPEASDAAMLQALAKAQINLDLDTQASGLSGGEKQRIGIARALLSSASIILLDEPTSALDDQHAQQLLQTLRHLAVNDHKTIIMVTHNPHWASQADAQLVLSNQRKPA